MHHTPSASTNFALPLQLHRMTADEFRQLEIAYTITESPFGPMLIATSGKGICYLSFGENGTEGLHQRYPFARIQPKENSWHRDVKKIVEQSVFFGENSGPDAPALPLHVFGTDFQFNVWQQLLLIPYGKQTCYKAIAANVGRPKAVRATGTAIGNNPVALLIPCHRVVTSAGKTGGYRWGIALKTRLIEAEKNVV